MDAFDWTAEFVTVAKLEPRTPEDPGAGGVLLHVVSDSKGLPDGDETFEDFLDTLLRESLTRRSDTGASSPCKVYTFAEGDAGERDRALLEEGLLMATDVDAFGEVSHDLLNRLASLPEATSGLVLLARLRATFGSDQGVQMACLFWLPYQDAHTLESGPVLALETLAEVIVRKQCRSLLYPFVQEGEVRHDQVKVFCRPASHPFPALLAVRPPPTTEELLQSEVGRALYSRAPEGEKQYGEYFDALPAKKRELFGEERLVKVADLIPPTDAAAVARESARTTKERYSKDQSLKLNIDGTVKIDARLENLGETFFFAERGNEKFMLVRGKHFMTSKAQLSSVDFMAVESLEEMLEKVRSGEV